MIKVGDRVKCINNKNHSCATPNGIIHSGLLEGREYIVYGIKQCPSCGTTAYDVGLTLFTKMNNSVCVCGNKTLSKGIWWAGSRRFVKQEEKVNYVKLNVKIEEPILN